MSQPVFHLRLLGPFGAEIAGFPFDNFATDKIRALLAYLAVEADHAHRRDTLAGLLWPDFPNDVALRNLRQALYRLREALRQADPSLDEQLITQTRHTVVLHSQALRLDCAQFTLAVRQAKSEAQPQISLPQAMQLYRGEFLQGFFLSDAYAFEEWLHIRRELFRQQALDALTYLTTLYERAGDHQNVLAAGQQALLLDPYHEKTHRQIMRAHWGLGNRAQAVNHFRKLQALLEAELGISSATATLALYEQIQFQAAPQRPPAPVKTLPEINATPIVRYHFPLLLTPLVGREPDLAYLVSRMQMPDCRLLTITGPGGMGKTRLGVEAARLLAVKQSVSEPHFDGIYFVALAPVTDAVLLATAVANSLEISLAQKIDPQRAVLDYLQTKRLLLMLDNFEQLLDTTPDEASRSVTFLLEILAAAPGVSLLVTSREPLHVQGEWVYPLGGLPFSAAGLDDPAPALFVNCARRYRPQFDPASHEAALYEICRQTGGLPLALEIAAAWIRSYDPEEIARQIASGLDFLTNPYRDAPTRQRSMRVIFDTTWQQLDPAQQHALAAMSLFRGGFTVAAAAVVAQASVLDIAILVEKSLLHRVDERLYNLHELLQQFAAEQLAAMGLETAVQERHATYYLTLLGEQRVKFNGPAPHDAQATIAYSIDNIRVAWRWAVENGRVALLLAAADGLAQFWVLAGNTREAEETFAFAFHHQLPPTNLEEDIVLLRGRLAGYLAWFQIGSGKRRLAEETIQQALALVAQSGDLEGRAYALSVLGWELQLQARYEEAEESLHEALALFEQTENWPQASLALIRLGSIFWRKREFRQALDYYQQSLQIETRLDNKRGLNRAYGGIGLAYIFLEQYDEALTWLKKALALEREMENSIGILRNMGNMGNLYYTLGDYAQALVCYQEAARLEEATTHNATLGIWLAGLGNTYTQLGESTTALPYFDRAITLHEQLGDRFNLCDALLGKGELYLLAKNEPMAQRFIDRGYQIAQDVGRQESVFRGGLLLARLFAQQGMTEQAVAELHRLQQSFTGDKYLAKIYFYRWQIEGDETVRQTAVHLHQTLLIRIPNSHELQYQMQQLNAKA